MLRLANPNVCRIRVCETESPFYHELFHPGAPQKIDLQRRYESDSFATEIMAVLLIHAQRTT